MLKIGFSSNDASAVLDSLGRALAIIEFKPDGTILAANENFCRAIGYDLSEIVGKHHRMFVEPGFAASAEYADFWVKLARGEFDAREYKRFAKGGREIWIQASYNPVRDSRGRVVKVVKVATDITAQKIMAAEFAGKLEAISRAQAVIEFTTEGQILTANQNFLATVGYALGEIQGQHHRMFVEPAYGHSAEYLDFWRRLNAGEFIAAEFKRLGKGGKEIWIQASYNPVFDPNGTVVKIVKFAVDVTARVRAVSEIADGLSALAEKNLEVRLDRPFEPAFDKIRDDFNRSMNNMEAALAAVGESADAIGSGVQQITSASGDLSLRTEQQAASLEETAAALGEITSTVQRGAEGAQQAIEVAAAAKADALRSGQVMDQAVAAMVGINESSTKITQIIGVIDEIAFQTNLLALNAGVEAARAGEAGRGFAVVAQEVRALAQRSAEAAKEIKALIASSSEQVKRGVTLVDTTGQALKDIVAKVGEMDALIAEMAKGARDQSTGLTEVNTAVNQMDQVTQKNAAMAEEATAAASTLAGEAKQMRHLLNEFRTRNAGRASSGAELVRLKPARAGERMVEPMPARRPKVSARTAGNTALAMEDWAEF